MEDGRGGTSKATVQVDIAEPPSNAHKIAMRSAAKKSKFSSLDGRGNNVEHPEKEAAVFTQLRRLVSCWCCLVLFGVLWCCLVFFGVVWCSLVFFGVGGVVCWESDYICYHIVLTFH
jgi:hypothetical protein